MKINSSQPLATYAKATQDGKVMRRDSKPSWKVITALLGVIIFVVGSISVVLITRQQDTTPVAPTAPQSQPAAYIEKTQTCTLTFNVDEEEEPVACGQTGCQTDTDCRQMDGGSTTFTCIEASNGNKYCSDERYEDACASNPSFANCCEAQEEEEDLVCGEVGCNTDNDCEDDLVCVTADNDRKYCADERYEDACIDSPSERNCCEAPVTTTTTTTTTATVTTKVTATATTTPRVTDVITTVACNDTCSANADCSNVSHICYEGRCRLDVNPTDAQCRLPDGGTTISRPAVVPTESGPADWMNYLKAGLGVLGIGALLLLLL